MSIFFVELCLNIHIDMSFLKEYQSFDDLEIEVANTPDNLMFFNHIVINFMKIR
jgi:hypothetical protein